MKKKITADNRVDRLVQEGIIDRKDGGRVLHEIEEAECKAYELGLRGKKRMERVE